MVVGAYPERLRRGIEVGLDVIVGQGAQQVSQVLHERRVGLAFVRLVADHATMPVVEVRHCDVEPIAGELLGERMRRVPDTWTMMIVGNDCSESGRAVGDPSCQLANGTGMTWSTTRNEYVLVASAPMLATTR